MSCCLTQMYAYSRGVPPSSRRSSPLGVGVLCTVEPIHGCTGSGAGLALGPRAPCDDLPPYHDVSVTTLCGELSSPTLTLLVKRCLNV